MRGIVVYLDHQAVRTGGNGSLGQRFDHPVDTARVGGIDDDRQVAHALEHRHCGDIQRVAGVFFVGADAAFAQNDIFVAAGHDIFGRHKEFFHRVGKAALEQDGLAGLPQFLEQLEVLHIACADLEAVAFFHEQLNMRGIGDFGDDRQSGCFVRLVQ